MLGDESDRVQQVLREGLVSKDHAAFAARLKKAK
jgi:hypothetical protein